MIKAVIVDSNPQLCEKIRRGLEKTGIRVAAVCHDGADGLARIRELGPDLVILDLILSRVDGVGLIETLREEGMDALRIFVMTGMNLNDCASYLQSLDISGFFLKPYDVDVLVRRVAAVMKPEQPQSTLQGMMDTPAARLAFQWLHRLAVPPHIQGYTFLAAAITMVVEQPELLHAMMTQLYPAIAREYHTTVACVERNMRNAVELAWNRCRVEDMESVFGYTLDENKDKPANRVFIATLADHIRMERMIE